MTGRLLVLALVLAAAAPPASAQPRRDGTDAPGARREKIKQKIRALRAYALTDTLQLDEKAAARLFPVLAKWDDVTDKLVSQKVDLSRRLETVSGTDAKAIDRLIDDQVANQRALWDLEDKRLVELRRILTPLQIAKLLVVLPRFERRIQNQLRRAIENRGGRRARRESRIEHDDDEVEDDVDAAPTPRLPDLAPCDPYSTARGCAQGTRR